MSSTVRGRALIINIKNFFLTRELRDGSEVDYENISRLFKDLNFDIVKTQKELTNLSPQVNRSLYHTLMNGLGKIHFF